MTKVDAILQHAKRLGAVIAMDSNARSTSWHDTITNNRGKHLEEYIISKHLHIMNEPSTNTTFANRTGKSKIDLTLITSNLLRRISDWKINDEESNSDHSPINYDIKTDISHKNDGTEIYSERGKHGKIPKKYTKDSGEHDLETEQRK
jgi:endonuclease/exonuclease/phosphatase family metal-dependent hydrolase